MLILSDIQIRQCVHYRIDQKIRYLDRLGIKALHLAPDQVGRIRSYLTFCHTVIIYRSRLRAGFIRELRDAGCRVLFECDDLIIGAEQVRQSGILREISDHMGAGLCDLADGLRDTALLCDGLILSTDHLAGVYGAAGSGLSQLPIHVLPNFLESDCTAAPRAPRYSFAYTTPSGSIRTELGMLSEFLRSHDAASQSPWNILVMGNPLAARELEAMAFRNGHVQSVPFSEYDSYIEQIGHAACVLIPLAPTAFNSAKTPIRVMDTALAGTQALFSPVGANDDVARVLPGSPLPVADGNWAESGRQAGAVIAARGPNVVALQGAVNALYGPAAALRRYEALFVDGLGIVPAGRGGMRGAA